MRRIIAMPAVERLLFAIGAIAIVMAAMTYSIRPGPKGMRNWAAGEDRPAASASAPQTEQQDRFIGLFAR